MPRIFNQGHAPNRDLNPECNFRKSTAERVCFMTKGRLFRRNVETTEKLLPANRRLSFWGVFDG